MSRFTARVALPILTVCRRRRRYKSSGVGRRVGIAIIVLGASTTKAAGLLCLQEVEVGVTEALI